MTKETEEINSRLDGLGFIFLGIILLGLAGSIVFFTWDVRESMDHGVNGITCNHGPPSSQKMCELGILLWYGTAILFSFSYIVALHLAVVGVRKWRG